MAASVRVEDEAFADIRYERLASACGLADADHARGKMLVLWRQCTIEHTHNLLVSDVVKVLGTNAVSGLLVARLGDRTTIEIDGEKHEAVRIRGTAGRIEWLKKLRENGKKGGRPRKNQKVSTGKTKREPSGSENQNPPAPAPAPAQTHTSVCLDARDTRTDPPHRSGSDMARVQALVADLSSEHTDRHNRLAKRLGVKRPPVSPADPGFAELQRRLVERVEQGRTLEEAAEDMRAVMAHNEASAEAERKLSYFGVGSWKPDRFRGTWDRLGEVRNTGSSAEVSQAAVDFGAIPELEDLL